MKDTPSNRGGRQTTTGGWRNAEHQRGREREEEEEEKEEEKEEDLMEEEEEEEDEEEDEGVRETARPTAKPGKKLPSLSKRLQLSPPSVSPPDTPELPTTTVMETQPDTPIQTEITEPPRKQAKMATTRKKKTKAPRKLPEAERAPKKLPNIVKVPAKKPPKAPPMKPPRKQLSLKKRGDASSSRHDWDPSLTPSRDGLRDITNDQLDTSGGGQKRFFNLSAGPVGERGKGKGRGGKVGIGVSCKWRVIDSAYYPSSRVGQGGPRRQPSP